MKAKICDRRNSEVVLGYLLAGHVVAIDGIDFVMTNKYELCIVTEYLALIKLKNVPIERFVQMCENMTMCVVGDIKKIETNKTYH